jgi:hypothetical protein
LSSRRAKASSKRASSEVVRHRSILKQTIPLRRRWGRLRPPARCGGPGGPASASAPETWSHLRRGSARQRRARIRCARLVIVLCRMLRAVAWLRRVDDCGLSWAWVGARGARQDARREEAHYSDQQDGRSNGVLPLPRLSRLPAGLAHLVTRRCIACTGKDTSPTHTHTCVQSLTHTRSHADTIPKRARVKLQAPPLPEHTRARAHA